MSNYPLKLNQFKVNVAVQDPATLQLLDPGRSVEHRYQPIPERAIRNGRPRSYLLPKPKDQGSHVHLGNQLPSRPQSAAAGCTDTSASQMRPRNSPRLRAALKALRQVKRSPSIGPMYSGYEEEHKQRQANPPPWAVTGRPPWGAGGGFKADGIENAPIVSSSFSMDSKPSHICGDVWVRIVGSLLNAWLLHKCLLA